MSTSDITVSAFDRQITYILCKSVWSADSRHLRLHNVRGDKIKPFLQQQQNYEKRTFQNVKNRTL